MNHITEQLNQFSAQMKFALENYNAHEINGAVLQNIIVCGMGSSAVSGSIAKGYFADKLELPVEVVNDYQLPRYAGAHTLVIVISFSGNTEETLAAYKIAHEKGCKILLITAGGELEKLGLKYENRIYKIEAEGVGAHTALGAPLTYVFLIFFELLGQYKNVDLTKIAEFVVNSEDYAIQSNEMLKHYSAPPNNKYIIVCDTFFQGLAVRFAQQLQHYAKVEAFVQLLPEGSHTFIESYYQPTNTTFMFLNSRNNQRTNLRFGFVKELLKKHNAPVMEPQIKDMSMNTVFHLTYLLDWLALQVAEKTGATASPAVNSHSLNEFMTQPA